MKDAVNRRSALKAFGSAGFISALPEGALGFGKGQVVQEVATPGMDADAKPKYSIKFSVIGLDHNHIMSMTSAVKRGGGELVSVCSTNPKSIADFQKRFGAVKVAKSVN